MFQWSLESISGSIRRLPESWRRRFLTHLFGDKVDFIALKKSRHESHKATGAVASRVSDYASQSAYALQMNGNQICYLNDPGTEGGDEIEQQADALAKDSLIPASNWPAVALTTPAAVTALAQTLSISPCIVAGRIRHETGDHTLFSRQFRDKVKTVLGMA
ncbi:hypothetical protein AB2J22_20810 [Aeromonas sp. A5]|uniref:hypothetical protein n=1 Tax=unclassified Aeromonas TaxID=257493 RepID=UPI00376FA837